VHDRRVDRIHCHDARRLQNIESLVAELEIKLRQQAQILMSFFETSLALLAFLRRLGASQETKKEWDNMSDVNESLDARRIARDQESRIAASTLIGLNAAKPFVEFQTSMLRLFADNCELAARNYEKGLEAFGNVIEQQSQTRQ
jgi:hypothetical protein